MTLYTTKEEIINDLINTNVTASLNYFNHEMDNSILFYDSFEKLRDWLNDNCFMIVGIQNAPIVSNNALYKYALVFKDLDYDKYFWFHFADFGILALLGYLGVNEDTAKEMLRDIDLALDIK